MGFINGAILFGLSALAAPVIIHLIRSRRFRQETIGTLRFLKQAVQETKSWRRLQRLLLLTARLLIVALLTFLFARPFFEKPDEESSAQLDALLLIDASGSMNGEALGVSNFTLARDAALKTLKELPNGAKATVAVFSDAVEEVEDLEHADLRPAGATDYTAMSAWARDRLKLSAAKERKVYLFTDMQRKGLPGDPLGDWPLDVDVELMPAIKPGDWNCAVADVRNLSPYLGGDGEVEVQLACFGATPEAQEVTVSLQLGGVEVEKTALLRNGAVRMNWTPVQPGEYTGVARVDAEDAWAADNERHFVFNVREPLPVLLVNGSPGSTMFQDETYYIEMALKISKRRDGQSELKCEVRREIEDLTPYRVVALCNVGALGKDEVAELKRYLANGGKAVWFLGNRTSERMFNEFYDAGVFPAALRELDVPVPRTITEWDKEHPALQLFTGRESGDLSRIVFRDVFRLEPDEDAHVLARLSNGAPAIIEQAVGRGSVIAFANPADRDWSDWPKERIFVPVIRETFSYLADIQNVTDQARVEALRMNGERDAGAYKDNDGWFVVAPDARESDIVMADEAEFRRSLGFAELADAPEEEQEVKDVAPLKSERENEFWVFLAIGLLGLMVAENYLADRSRA
ncbi:BatA domain-containing protein [Candidatus Sumerlaeota bacterium]|nr:BatA domain-containing protein [Candidatus Sumerlaeota bacterium]